MADNETKELFKQAINEWLEAKYAAFGRFTFHGAIALIFSAIVYVAVNIGWRPPV